MDQCTPWKVSTCGENLALQVLQSQKVGVCHELPGWAGINHYRPNECFALGRVNLMLAFYRLLLARK
jgi:hypothetical protein